jgi:hypothetical protein
MSVTKQPQVGFLSMSLTIQPQVGFLSMSLTIQSQVSLTNHLPIFEAKVIFSPTVNPETRTPQNGFDFYDLSWRNQHYPEHDKNIKSLITFIFYHSAAVKQDQNDTFVVLFEHRFVMQKLQNPPLCSSTFQNVLAP